MVKEYRLENGLEVILEENHNSPVVSLDVWVKVGSADEPIDKLGISHIMEHMLFKGTTTRGRGQIAYEVESLGGHINAFTSFDCTVYYIVISSRFIDKALDILSDAIQNTTFPEDELESEKNVILEELKRAKDTPSIKINRELFETAFTVHPFKYPIIGFENTVSSITREELFNFYKKWYSPSNMCIVAVGDFSTDILYKKIKEAFSNFKGLPTIRNERPKEPPQNGLKIKITEEDINETYCSIAFHIPKLIDEDMPAIDLISVILAQGDSARLSERLKSRKQLLYHVSSYAYSPSDPGLFIIETILDSSKIYDACESILEELLLLCNEKVSIWELNKGKTNIESFFIYNKETVEAQAKKYGYYKTITGDISFEKKYIEDVKKQTAEDIQKVAKKYFSLDNMTINIIYPKNCEKISEGNLRTILEKKFNSTAGSLSYQITQYSLIKRLVLENGVRVILKKNSSVPIISMKAVCLGGLRYEDENNNGISNFVSMMMTKGTRYYKAEELAKNIESMAGYVNNFSGRNSFGITFNTLSQYFNESFALFSEMIFHTKFYDDEIEKGKEEVISTIKQQNDNPSKFVINLFTQTLFKKHPYRFNPIGSENSIKRITKLDLEDFYNNLVVPENVVLSFVGDINEDTLLRKLSQINIISKKPLMKAKNFEEPPQEEIRTNYFNKQIKQAHIFLGFKGAKVNSFEKYVFEVICNILSGQGGRLFLELRDKKGLAYAITALSVEGLDPGYFGVYIGTSPQNVQEAIEGIKKELFLLTTEKVSEEELERAKKYIIGNYEIDLQRNSTQAMTLAYNELYGFGLEEYKEYSEKIMKITSDDILNIAKSYIDLNKYTLAILSPEKIEGGKL